MSLITIGMAIIYSKTDFPDLGIHAQVAQFNAGDKLKEWHVVMHVEPRRDLFAAQMERLYKAEEKLLQTDGMKGAQCIMKRYFLSDSTNQQPLMPDQADVATSIIQQQPLDGSKIAVWLYLQEQMQVTTQEGMMVASHNGYRHLWRMGMHSTEGDSAQQTEDILREYEHALHNMGATLADNCVRTWFFVRDVDTQYAGMVKARRDNFAQQGLTEHTHYIASTGIGGLPADTHALIQMGAYAIIGLRPGQQRYLYAPTHLNPTYEYGVTFERGTCVEYGDRAHVLISGTASIDNHGNVMHVGDIVRQTHRMWENVETLLREADSSYEDVMQMVVYLRDIADYDIVQQMFSERFPSIPMVIALAPVCRPTWLIEMECMAVKKRDNVEFPDF